MLNALIGAVLGANALSAAGGPLEPLDFVVTAELFARISHRLELVGDDRAQVLFDDYWEAAQSLAAEVLHRIDEAGWQDGIAMIKALPPGEDPPAEYGSLVHQWRIEVRAGLREHDALRKAFLDDLAALVDDAMLHALDRVPTIIRLGHCVQKIGVRHGDFQPRIDLIAIARAASAEGEELHGLLPEHLFWLEDPTTPRDRIVLALLEWERKLDLIAQDEGAWRRRPQPETEKYRASPDDAAARRRVENWARAHDALARATDEIRVVLLLTRGEEAADEWDARVRAEFCPELTGDVWPAHMFDWLHSLPDLDDPAPLDQAENVLRLQQTFVATHRRLVSEAIDRGVRVRRHQSLGQADDDGDELQYVIALYRIGKHIHDTLDQLRGIITSEQAGYLDAKLLELRRYSVGALGPLLSDRQSAMLPDGKR